MKHDLGMVTVYEGDALARLREMPSGSVQCVVTSPPYFGLRNYGADGQIGLERTPDEYIGKMVEVFGELRRILRNDGTIWLNIGDSYAGGAGGRGDAGSDLRPGRTPVGHKRIPNAVPNGCKTKDLLGIPWLLAFALRADGWYLRSEIIWHKPNPMPESVTDRPTKAHEQIFLLTKRADYFCDMEAVKVASLYPDDNRAAREKEYHLAREGISRLNPSTAKTYPTANLRTVWTITTKPYADAHFATFPPELPERCIKAGTSLRGCCPACGAPWARVVERDRTATPVVATTEKAKARESGIGYYPPNSTETGGVAGIISFRTVGWQQSCDCPEHEPTPCTVLDPFGGSGTVGEVAVKLGRRAVLIELNPKYVGLMRERFGKSVPLFTAAAGTGGAGG